MINKNNYNHTYSLSIYGVVDISRHPIYYTSMLPSPCTTSMLPLITFKDEQVRVFLSLKLYNRLFFLAS